MLPSLELNAHESMALAIMAATLTAAPSAPPAAPDSWPTNPPCKPGPTKRLETYGAHFSLQSTYITLVQVIIDTGHALRNPAARFGTYISW